jgi:hypothetical protein
VGQNQLILHSHLSVNRGKPEFHLNGKPYNCQERFLTILSGLFGADTPPLRSHKNRRLTCQHNPYKRHTGYIRPLHIHGAVAKKSFFPGAPNKFFVRFQGLFVPHIRSFMFHVFAPGNGTRTGYRNNAEAAPFPGRMRAVSALTLVAESGTIYALSARKDEA